MRVIINEPETLKKLSQFLEDNKLKICNEAERKEDEVSHWALKRELRSPNRSKEEKLRFVLVEVRSMRSSDSNSETRHFLCMQGLPCVI